MYCVKCGKEAAEDEQYCGYCGAKLNGGDGEEVALPEVKPGKSGTEGAQGRSAGTASRRGKGKRFVIIGIAAAAVLIAAAAVFLIFGAGLKAKSMSLHDYEGDITLSNDSGEVQEIFKDRRMADGDALTTGDESRAYVMLEKDRLVTLMGLSRAQFHKSGAEIELTLSEGSLFFNIVRQLDEEESLEIETSNVVLSIRGTSGYVDTDENGSEVLYLTSGEVHFRAVSPVSGEEEDGDVKAGQKLTVTILDDGSLEVKIEEFPETALPAEAAEEILGDAELLAAVLDATGWDETELITEERAEAGSESDESKNGMVLAIPQTVVDGVLHQDYYTMRLEATTTAWLDDVIEACRAGDKDRAIDLCSLESTNGDTIRAVETDLEKYSGHICRIYHNDLKCCVTIFDMEESKQVTVYIIPEEGLGYAVRSMVSYTGDWNNYTYTFATCPCTGWMYNGEMDFHEEWKTTGGGPVEEEDVLASGTVMVVNGLYDGVLERSTIHESQFSRWEENLVEEFVKGKPVSRYNVTTYDTGTVYEDDTLNDIDKDQFYFVLSSIMDGGTREREDGSLDIYYY